MTSSHEVPLNRVERAMLKYGYTLGEDLGKGSYAKVKLGTHLTGRKVAVKIIDRRKAIKSEFVKKFLPRELELIRKIKHVNIVRVEMVLDDGVCVCEVQELAERGTLLQHIQKHGRVTDSETRIMFKQMLCAIDYLHSHDVVHRDLKCENVLLDKHDNVKITDFGFVRTLHDDEMSQTWCGSKAYAAPEILQGKSYNGKGVDVWSAGVILYIVITGLMPYDERNKQHMMQKQMAHRVTYHHKVALLLSEGVKAIIYAMLQPQPLKRPSARSLHMHQWLLGTPWILRTRPIFM